MIPFPLNSRMASCFDENKSFPNVKINVEGFNVKNNNLKIRAYINITFL